MTIRATTPRVRRQFTEEFKAGAVRLVLDEERTVGAVARELDLTPSALAGWVRAGQAECTQGKSGLMKEEREELVRLRKELRIVQEERDILKKAAAYFATQSGVVARILTGPHDANRQDSHLPMLTLRPTPALSHPPGAVARACVRRRDSPYWVPHP